MAKLPFGSIRLPPNQGSQHQTPASLIYDLHWENLQLIERWDWARFARFSAFLKHTPYELGSLVTLKHAAVDAYQRHNRLTMHNAQATALILTLLEAHLLVEWKKDIIQNPFPNVSVADPDGKNEST